MTDLFTYIKERVVLLNWAALAFALVCFAYGSFELNGHRLAESVGVLAFLILFRLYVMLPIQKLININRTDRIRRPPPQ